MCGSVSDASFEFLIGFLIEANIKSITVNFNLNSFYKTLQQLNFLEHLYGSRNFFKFLTVKSKKIAENVN